MQRAIGYSIKVGVNNFIDEEIEGVLRFGDISAHNASLRLIKD